ncbi:hypothetical protein PVAP13_2NG351600 [Panicum virgatum]|uniref:Uncharacterized protein n=1 Tax=Panicum virgatum TaxID=38727 RepID=A0A8T0VJL3_PANVG|nr:hypothetical protein PVAP13_2NG351600 [Panicum virgatum]
MGPQDRYLQLQDLHLLNVLGLFVHARVKLIGESVDRMIGESVDRQFIKEEILLYSCAGRKARPTVIYLK